MNGLASGAAANLATIQALIANGNNAQANVSNIADTGAASSSDFNNNDFHSVYQDNYLNDADYNSNTAYVDQLTDADAASNAAAITQAILNGNNAQTNLSTITDTGL